MTEPISNPAQLTDMRIPLHAVLVPHGKLQFWVIYYQHDIFVKLDTYG